jgi:hypothetical protein
MRRSRLVQLVGMSLLTAALLVPTSAMASSTQPARGAVEAQVIAPILAEIKLGCDLTLLNPLGPARTHRAIVCKWAAPTGVDVAKYRIWRSVDGGVRKLVATITPPNLLRYADHFVYAYHTYTYTVVGLAADGTRVAISPRVKVFVGRPLEILGMRCSMTAIGDTDGVYCRWAAATRPAAARYVLLRSVNGGPREAIYRTSISGIRSFVDKDVASGQTIRYAVLAVSSTGRIVSRGGPIVVVVP